MMTFFAPPSMWAAAPSRLVKTPVDSTTMSAPTSPQGISAGSRSAKVLISWSPTCRTLPSKDTSSCQIPWVESCLKRFARLSKGIRSLAATTSISPRSIAAFVNSIPIRPKPFTPTLTATYLSSRLRLQPDYCAQYCWILNSGQSLSASRLSVTSCRTPRLLELLHGDLSCTELFLSIYLFHRRRGLIGKRHRIPLQVFLTGSNVLPSLKFDALGCVPLVIELVVKEIWFVFEVVDPFNTEICWAHWFADFSDRATSLLSRWLAALLESFPRRASSTSEASGCSSLSSSISFRAGGRCSGSRHSKARCWRAAAVAVRPALAASKLVTRFALALASPRTALASYSRTASLRPIWARTVVTPSALLV